MRGDSNSRKILNFGHTIGHALEEATSYGRFRHGEAVAYGILTASKIAKKLEFCDETIVNLLNDVVRSVGGLPRADDVNVNLVFDAIAFDKKSIQNSVQWVLLESIGSPRIVSGKDIPDSIVLESINEIFLT